MSTKKRAFVLLLFTLILVLAPGFGSDSGSRGAVASALLANRMLEPER